MLVWIEQLVVHFGVCRFDSRAFSVTKCQLLVRGLEQSTYLHLSLSLYPRKVVKG